MSLESPKISEEALDTINELRKKIFFYGIPGLLLFNYGIHWIVSLVEKDKGTGHFYSSFYLYYPIITASIVVLVTIYYYHSMQYFTRIYLKVGGLTGVFIVSNLLLLLSSSPLLSENIKNFAIHTSFIAIFTLLLIYYIRYRKIWRNIMQGAQGIKYAKQMEAHGWTHNISATNVFKNKDAKNALDTKLVNKIAWFFIRYGWIGGLLIYLSSTGMGGDSLLFFVSLISLLVAPEFGRVIAYGHEMYLYISRIEKENKVTIYNDIWND